MLAICMSIGDASAPNTLPRVWWMLPASTFPPDDCPSIWNRMSGDRDLWTDILRQKGVTIG